jgi:hypothetical protein
VTALSDIKSAGSLYKTYYYAKRTGDLTISSNINIGTDKIVLLVDGKVNINAKINLTAGRGFFMVVSSGDISVRGSVGNDLTDPIPDVEGLYFTDGAFNSASTIDATDNAPQKQMHLRGTVVANSFSLTRTLADNSQDPAEYFEFSPSLLLQLPTTLGSRQVIWREVAP